MKTKHQIIFENAADMQAVPDHSVGLVVTSPPYPMIAMWDESFGRQNPQITRALANQKGWTAFELMHSELDRVWHEIFRILIEGGIVCINVGDAVRSLGGRFSLYPNSSRIQSRMLQIGFTPLPLILWRKQTNAPNKFMGSGMLPAGAYVTLEHEYILILRKGSKRTFTSEAEKKIRRQSAFFWEERNRWFSDVWMDLKGSSQTLADNTARLRSAAFPFELPYRLINMFSVTGDTVVDPFAGIGTTMWAAIASARHSIGYEIDHGLHDLICAQREVAFQIANAKILERLRRHQEFVLAKQASGSHFNHVNPHHGFAVMTGQESDLLLNSLAAIQQSECCSFAATYSPDPVSVKELHIQPELPLSAARRGDANNSERRKKDAV